MSDIDRAAQDAVEKLEQTAEETATKVDQVAEDAAMKLHEVATEAETVRVAQEETRQRQEHDRRVAEGGRQVNEIGDNDEEETGRVEAETGRVGAETNRERAHTQRELVASKVVPRSIMVIAIATALISLLPALFAIWLINRESDNRTETVARQAMGNRDALAQQCRENEVQDAIIVSVLRSTGNLKLPPALLQDYRDAIVALEPKGEKPCPLQTGVTP